MSRQEICICDRCGLPGPGPDGLIQTELLNTTGGDIPAGDWHAACYVRVVNDNLIPDVVHEPAEAVVACTALPEPEPEPEQTGNAKEVYNVHSS
jgi:hypothetical protein